MGVGVIVYCTFLLNFLVRGQITTENLLRCPETCDEICPNGVASCKKTVTTDRDLKIVTMTLRCLHDNGTDVEEPRMYTYTNPEVGTNFGTKCSTYNTFRTYNFDGDHGQVNIRISGNQDVMNNYNFTNP